MPRFTKKNKPLKAKARKSFVRKKKSSSVRVVKAQKPKTESSANNKTPAKSKPKNTLATNDIPQIAKKDIPSKNSVMQHEASKKPSMDFDVSLMELERVIEEKARSISQEAEGVATISEDPDAYDGVSSLDEHVALIQEQLQHERQQSRKLKHEIELLKTEFEDEKTTLEKHIKELKRELHRTAPLHDNKLFSLSKELRTAIDAIQEFSTKDEFEISEKIVETQQPTTPSTPPSSTPDTSQMPSVLNPEKTENSTAETQQSTTETEKPLPTEAKNISADSKDKESSEIEEKQPAKVKTDSKKKKVAVAGAGAAVAAIVLFGGMYQFFSSPSVDDELVQAYLEDSSGSVLGTTEEDSAPTQTETGFIEYSDNHLLNNPIPFDETIWENFGDPIIGINVQYPSNATKLIKTESSATFSRKDGFIFKVQRVETQLNVEEYWDQIRSTSLSYESELVEWKTREALLLTLNEESAMPGNRYLVQVDEAIIDVWYAIEGSKLSPDDLQRAEHMLNTISFR